MDSDVYGFFKWSDGQASQIAAILFDSDVQMLWEEEKMMSEMNPPRLCDRRCYLWLVLDGKKALYSTKHMQTI